jgi:hypothetical protein
MSWNLFQWATAILAVNCFIVAAGAFYAGYGRIGVLFVLYGLADVVFVGMRG